MNPIFQTKPLSDLISSINKTAKLHQSHERVQGYKIIKGLKYRQNKTRQLSNPSQFGFKSRIE